VWQCPRKLPAITTTIIIIITPTRRAIARWAVHCNAARKLSALSDRLQAGRLAERRLAAPNRRLNMHETCEDRPGLLLPLMVVNRMNRLSSSTAWFQYLFLSCAAIVALGSSVALWAQDASSAAAVDAPSPHTAPATAAQPVPATVPVDAQAPQIPASTDENSRSHPGTSPGHRQQGRELVGSGQGHQSQSTEGIRFSLWGRSPLDALRQGDTALPTRAFGSGVDMSNSGAAFQGANAACLFCGMTQTGLGAAAMGGHGSGVPGQMNFDQIMRGSMGLDMKSSLGNFRMFYTGEVDGKADGGMNKGSTQATFSSASFAGLFNFSAATTLAGGSSLPGGFSSGEKGSNFFDSTPGAVGPLGGADSQKHPTTSLTMRLSF
jgi:hypothetical protein